MGLAHGFHNPKLVAQENSSWVAGIDTVYSTAKVFSALLLKDWRSASGELLDLSRNSTFLIVDLSWAPVSPGVLITLCPSLD